MPSVSSETASPVQRLIALNAEAGRRRGDDKKHGCGRTTPHLKAFEKLQSARSVVPVKALDALRTFFKPNDVTIALPDSPFVVIDRERAIERLKLNEKAEEAGTNEFPPSDATEFDGIEAQIAAEMGEYLNRAQVDASNNHSVYGQRLAELALLRELSSVTGASQTALGDYNAAIIDWKNRLANAADAIRDSFSELSAFKTEHGLARPAHAVPPAIYTWSAILGSWALESMGNTAFLRVNDEFGLLGGFVAAAVVAAINVFLSALVGRYWWPYLFHKSPVRRALAIVGSMAWGVALIAWNLLAAHFRDAKSLGFDQPETQALAMLLNNPLGLTSIYSYGLLAMGMAFGVIAALAAYKMDDPYPAYGPIYRRHESRCEDYADEIEEALEELRAIRDDGINSARVVREQLRSQFAERGQIISARDSHRARFEEHQDYLETVGNSLLDHYRSANRRARTTPPPRHFGDKWHVPRSALPPVPDEPSIQAEVEAAQRSLDQSIETISQAYNEAIKSFRSLEDIKRSLTNG